MSKNVCRLSVIALMALSLLFLSQPAQARWYIESEGEITETVNRMLDETLLQVRSDIYFTVDVAQVESTPQAAGVISAPLEIAKYAVVLDGVIDKIINWDGYSENSDLSENAVIIKLPDGDGVAFLDEAGVIRLAPIYQGSIVSEQVSPCLLYTSPSPRDS